MAHINSHALAPSLQPKLRYQHRPRLRAIVLVASRESVDRRHMQNAKTVKDIVRVVQGAARAVSFGSAGAGSASIWRWRCSSFAPR